MRRAGKRVTTARCFWPPIMKIISSTPPYIHAAPPGLKAVPSGDDDDNLGPGGTTQKAVVYFVDDDVSLRHSAAMLLEVSGFAPLTFGSAESLLSACDEACRSNAQGCFVLDLNLPGLDGAELLSELRKRGSKLPAILITHRGSDARGRAAQLQAAGFGLILEKPFPRGELVSAVRTALRLPLEH